ncbi:glycosyltransferase family 2 protein [Candidatus Uhrbacteria bacterium]|nr:glycosyltransferase family 2 protein [Candidatus Uhrbacteria bacterium]
MTPQIGIIIVSYNAAECITQCLKSLSSSLMDFAPGQVQVLIWDNNSQDGTVEWIKQNYPQYQLHLSPDNVGFDAANNFGYKILQPSQYLVLLNDDTVVDKDWLKNLIKTAEARPETMIVQSQLRLWPDQEILNSWGNEIHFLGYGYAGGYKVKAVAAPVGQLNDGKVISYASGAGLLGYQTVLAPDSIVYHQYQFKKSMAKYFYMERNRWLVLLQNYHWATLVLLAPALITMELGTFVYSLLTGWYKEKLKVYSYFCHGKNWAEIRRKRQVVQTMRRKRDREVAVPFTGRIEFQDLQNPLLTIINPIFGAYWYVIKNLIWW